MQIPFLMLNVVSVALVIALVGWYAMERVLIRRFALLAIDSGLDTWDAAHRLGGFIHLSVTQLGDDPAVHPLLAPLGAVPMAVVRRGGCCSGISRLYILALEAIGVDAAQITLYHSSGNAQHCLVEVSIDGTRQVVDPTYGFAYRTAVGQPMSLVDLQAGKQPRFAALPSTGRSSYPTNSYYAFDYPATKTANWTKSRVRRMAYRFLSRVPFLKIDRFLLPPSLEWPQLIMAIGLMFVVLSVDFLAAVATHMT